MFEVGIIRHLPPFMREYRELVSYFDVCDTELAELNGIVSEYWNARLAVYCSERMLGRLERSFGIDVDDVAADTGIRRANVIAAINSRPPVTEATLHGILRGVCGGDYRYVFDYNAFALTVFVRRTYTASLYRRFRALIPANIALTVNCTRNTYRDILGGGRTYRELAGYTYAVLIYDRRE